MSFFDGTPSSPFATAAPSSKGKAKATKNPFIFDYQEKEKEDDFQGGIYLRKRHVLVMGRGISWLMQTHDL